MQYKKLLKRFAYKCIDILGSKQFFYGVIALFVLQALWFVFSAQYPMAFDENFHFGLIQVYREQLSPIITETPEGTGPLGALTREPSYLFAYLMSFPLRFFAWFTSNIDTQIILLRLINVCLFVAGLFAFRKLLLRIGASTALTHFAILAFTLIPIVPFLAAHINYDNLLFLLIPYVLMLTMTCAEGLRKNNLSAQPFILLFTLCCITSIVKYPFLPIAAAIVLYLVAVAVWRKQASDLKKIIRSIPKSFSSLSLGMRIGLISVATLSGSLFIERYGVNYIQYGSVVPDCAEVVNFEHCSQYGPWIRNHEIRQNAPEYVEPNLAFYAINWYYDMTYRLFFAINSHYYTQQPLFLPFITSHFIAVSGIFLSILFLPRLIRRYRAIGLFLTIILIYSGTLFFRGYNSYLATTEFLALNGRYFIPIMLLIFIIIGLAYKELFYLARVRASIWKMSFVIITILLLLQGGGVLTYILRSDDSWHRQDPLILNINSTARQVIEPFILQKDVEVPLSN